MLQPTQRRCCSRPELLVITAGRPPELGFQSAADRFQWNLRCVQALEEILVRGAGDFFECALAEVLLARGA